MTQARLASCISLPVEQKLLVAVIEKAKDWALMHGVGMRDKKNFTKDAIQIAPFVLFPSPFPRTEFNKAIELQPVLNELMHKVAHDDEFLEHTLQNTLQVDEFTAKLFDIWVKVRKEGIAQSLSLGLFRSDYLMQKTDCNKIKQVEFNTVAASFGAMTSNLPAMFRYILRQFGYSELIKDMPENRALSGLCSGIIEAYDLFGVPSAVVLLVVEEVSYNICDQRFHEFEIFEKRPDIMIYRKTLNDVYEETCLNDKKQLMIDGHPVAVVYYRSGYEPAQYPSSKDWDARLRVERSTTIKCPSIHYQLAGTKKVQQALAAPGVLEKFMGAGASTEKVRDIFTGLYSLDFDESGEKAVDMALADAERFVLKPQREGGGNNLYGSDLRDALLRMRHSRERAAYILMERILPPLIDAVAKQLGISETLNTKAGRLSGGERKRLTVACELLTNPSVLLLDEPTSGLDSVSSMSIAKALKSVASSGRVVACVIHQPSSQLFASADDAILLANGRTLYSGAIANIPELLKKSGFLCPQYYNMADYILEIASGEHTGNLSILEDEAKTYANEMRKLAEKEINQQNGKDNSAECEALLNGNISNVDGYKANFGQQMNALLRRGYIGALRDVHLTQIRLVTHLIVGLLLGALYNGAGAEASRMISNTGCLFFFLLFLYFSNAMPTIHTFPVESTVVLQEHLNKWYYLSTYCASKIIIDLPIQLLCATVFVIPAWYLTSQPLEANRFGLAWLVCALITILAQTFGLVVGAACGVKLGLFVIPAANIPMLMFSEFFIPYHEMPSYLQPLAWLSYFRYAFDAFLQTVYGFNRQALPCHAILCLFKYPQKYLDYLHLSQNFSADMLALVVWIVILKISLMCVLKYRVYKACR